MTYKSVSDALTSNKFFDYYSIGQFSNYDSLYKELVDNESQYKSLPSGQQKSEYAIRVSKKVGGYSLLKAYAAKYVGKPAEGLEGFIVADVESRTQSKNAFNLVKSIYRSSSTFLWEDHSRINDEINTRTSDYYTREYALAFYYSMELVMADLIRGGYDDIKAFSDIRDVFEGNLHPKEAVFSNLQKVSDYLLEHKLAIVGILGATIVGGISLWKK